jgi:hypothetical protein
MVVKAHPQVSVATASFELSTGVDISTGQFWSAVRAYFERFVEYVDAGTYGYFTIGNANDNYVFNLQPWFAPNMTQATLEELGSTFLDDLTDLGIQVNLVYSEYDNFYDAWTNSMSPGARWALVNGRMSSRLFPRANWQDDALLAETLEAMRYIVDDGGTITGVNVAAAAAAVAADNAVNPAWRDAVLHATAGVTWPLDAPVEIIRGLGDKLTSNWGQRWRDLTVASGAHVSEADYIEPEFQQAFWGDNYERLYAIKQQVDPSGVFYAQNAVGSEDWEMEGLILNHLPSQNSRLCRKRTGTSIDLI